MKIYNSGKKILLRKIHPYLKQVPKKGVVLDLGCGTGDLVHYLASCYPRLNFVAADIHSPTLNHAQQLQQKNVTYINNAKDSIPLNNNSIDFLYSTEVIEHVEDDHLFIKEVRRILKNNSLMLITTPNRKTVPLKGANPDHKRHYTIKELKKLLISKGFKVVNVDYRWPKLSRTIDQFLHNFRNKFIKPKTFQTHVVAVEKEKTASVKVRLALFLYDNFIDPILSLTTLIDHKINSRREKYNLVITAQKK